MFSHSIAMNPEYFRAIVLSSATTHVLAGNGNIVKQQFEELKMGKLKFEHDIKRIIGPLHTACP